MTKIVFFGTEKESSLVLEKLISNNFDISLVVTKPDSVKGRGQKIYQPDVKKLALKHNIAVSQPNNLKELVLPKNSSVGVLVSFGKIIPQSIIDSFKYGIINIHPSLLPQYRGPSPIETAILNGDDETGVSLISLSSKMDAGPIFAQEKISLSDQEYKSELYKVLFELGSKLLIKNLDKIVSEKLEPTPQNNSLATYCHLFKKTDGNLDSNNMSAIECERKVRAFIGFPKTNINFSGKKIIVTKAKSLYNFSGDNWPDIIKCKNNSFLQIEEIISPTSGKTMKVTDYLRGLR